MFFAVWMVPVADLSSLKPLDTKKARVAATTAVDFALQTRAGGFAVAIAANRNAQSTGTLGHPQNAEKWVTDFSFRVYENDVGGTASNTAESAANPVRFTFSTAADVAAVGASLR